MQHTLPFTTISASGEAREIEFPLHPETASAEQVGGMLTAILESLSREITSGEPVGNGDVLQALSMALAVRARMINAPETITGPLLHELVDSALDAAGQAKPIRTGRA